MGNTDPCTTFTYTARVGTTYTYSLSVEKLKPLARFARKLSKDSNFADEDFPGLKIRICPDC